MNRILPLLAVPLLTTVLMAPAHAFPPREWRFNVLLDNKPIGKHSFVLSLDQQQQVLKSEADFGVKFLGFSAYRYQHTAVERWEGGCLREIEARTNDNGEALALKGKKTEGGFALNGPAGTKSLPGCVMSFAYWNSAILSQPRLLNAQNGEYLPVEVRSLGAESLRLGGAELMARRYRLNAGKLSLDLWYGTGDQWLALETRTEDGRLLRYEIAEPSHLSSQSKRRA